MAWAKNGTPDTLTSTAGVLTISDLTAKKFNQFLWHTLSTANHIDVVTYDNNTNTDYAFRQSVDGGTDATVTSDTDIQIDPSSLNDNFVVLYTINISGEEKLQIGFACSRGVAGATNAPNRVESVGKVDTTTNSGQFTRVDVTNVHASPTNYPVDSNLSALGTN